MRVEEGNEGLATGGARDWSALRKTSRFGAGR